MRSSEKLQKAEDATLKLLEDNAKYVDARSIKFFEDMAKSAKYKKLKQLYRTIKHIKKIDGAVLTKKDFKKIHNQVLNKTAKHFKVTVFADVKYEYPKSKKHGSNHEIKSEALKTFIAKKQDIQRKYEDVVADFEDYDFSGLYDDDSDIKKSLQGFRYVVSAVASEDRPMNRIPMRNAYTLSRDWLKHAEGIDKKAYNDMGGQCVYELLAEHLSNPAKRLKMTKEKLFDIFNEFYKNQYNHDNEIYDLDFGLVDDCFPHDFTIDSGVTTEMIKHLCQLKKISLYAFDSKENCFEKSVQGSSSNYKPIVYYLVDGHMYLITDKASLKSIGESEKVNKNHIVSSMLEVESKPDKEEFEFVSAETFAEALKMENKTVYLNQSSINDEVYDYIKTFQKVPHLKSEHHNIVQFQNETVKIICDPNKADKCSWQDIKAICDTAEIPFKNQRIGGLIGHLRKKFFKTERRFLTTEEQDELIQNQESKCRICHEVTDKFEFDHIQALANGGSNNFDNFQALCKPCHLQKTEEERENSDFIKSDPIASTFNEKSLEIIQSHHFKQWAFIEKLYCSKKKNFKLDISGCHKIDHAKCRRNLVLHSKYDYPQYSVMDYPTEYDGSKIKCGYYFVETDNYFPFRGNGWYNWVLVRYALKQKIQMKITHQFLPSFTIANDYFNKFIQYLLDMSKDTKLGKKIVNSFVGCWGIQSSSMEHVTLTTSKHEASRELARDNVKQVLSRKINEDITIYSIFEQFNLNKDDMFLPLYNQIVAMEAMELHKLETFIRVNGGEPLERNTDAILYRGDLIDISNIFWDSEETVRKYRMDKIKPLKREGVCTFKRVGEFIPSEFQFRNFEEKDNFEEIANEIFESNKSCGVFGVAGAGKTTLAKMIIKKIEDSGKKCIKLAPTNKAASHIGGQTLHKFYLSLFLSNNYEKKLLKSLNNVDYMIIDEISMVKEIFYRFFHMIRRYVPKMKFIIIGDFKQFKPVKDRYEGTYEDSAALFTLVDFQRINLTKCRRSDSELFELYTNVERVRPSQFPFKELTDLNIAYTHVTRKLVNDLCMKKFNNGKESLQAFPSRINKKTQLTQVYEGLPIVAHRNLKKEKIYNSEMFVVSKIDTRNKTFSFFNDEEEMTMPIDKFSSMFYPAYCITCHVSQGCTFEKKYTIWDWNFERMDETARYVALSRATKKENIQIKL